MVYHSDIIAAISSSIILLFFLFFCFIHSIILLGLVAGLVLSCLLETCIPSGVTRFSGTPLASAEEERGKR